ncbi:MAG: cysteate synthase [Leptolyngbyaceae bacterium]|nr:cysteate synthase [Leptolyngbyaceae bacterium]
MTESLRPKGKPPDYRLRCLQCGASYSTDPFRLYCDSDHAPALLRTEYDSKSLAIKSHLPGIFQYIDWLPVERWLDTHGKPITYESKGLAHHLGLNHLYISFNGYWPERQAQLNTGSFKELEAATVLARIPEGHGRTLVITSAGNTGRAFANLCSRLKLPLMLVIPEKNLDSIWSEHLFNPGVRLIGVGNDGDYSDAIALGHHISQVDDFFPEGGVFNVARRDGMGLTVIDAAVTLGHLPDHYFQAIGSGSGGIAAWEASLRLLEDGRFGSHSMKLHLAQNHPFVPVVEAWKTRSRVIPPMQESLAKSQIQQVAASVLTNRTPAYSLAGGLYDALTGTDGEMYAVTNQETAVAQHLFETLEGIDICSASGVATAALMQAVESGTVQRQDSVLLNITSGGTRRIQHDYPVYRLQPQWMMPPNQLLSTTIIQELLEPAAPTRAALH